MAPSWYKARSYRARSVRDPRGVLKDFGTTVPEGVAIQICDSNADTRYALAQSDLSTGSMTPPGRAHSHSSSQCAHQRAFTMRMAKPCKRFLPPIEVPGGCRLLCIGLSILQSSACK